MSMVKHKGDSYNEPTSTEDAGAQQHHHHQGFRSTLSNPSSYRGFIAGVFSGVAKLAVGHPFDTIKVRLQTTDAHRFSGPLDCVVQTVRHEGVRGLYKGATPPLAAWVFLDSILMGSLTLYRRLLKETVFSNPTFRPGTTAEKLKSEPLPPYGHGVAGMLAGITVSFVATPFEHVKSRLQVQYSAKGSSSSRLYTGPIDCCKKILHSHGLSAGLYRGFTATVIFRSFFFVWWTAYDLLTTTLQSRTALSAPAVNFWAGGLSAQIFWLAAHPADVVRQNIMCDSLGGSHGDGPRRFTTWRQAVRTIAAGNGGGFITPFYRGFLPSFLRAFPANAAALVVFEGVMRNLPD